MKTQTEAEQKITKARSAMIQSQRFYGALALRLVPTASKRTQTTACDGKHLFYNPEWVEQVPTPELIGVIAAQVAHIANLHHTRRRGRDAKKWNEACDLAIHPIIRDAGFTLPDTALIDPAMVGLSAEEIFFRRAQEEQDDDGQDGEGEGGQGAGGAAGSAGKPEKGDEEGDDAQDGEDKGDDADGEGDEPSDGDQAPEDSAGDTGGTGEVLDAVNDDGSKPSPADIQQQEMEQQVAVVQAQNLASKAGQGSADIDRLAEALRQAQVDWKEELRRWMQVTAKSRYTYARPNRRFISQGVYLPSLTGEAMGEMVLLVDMSGSTSAWLKEFMGQMGAIREDLRPEKLTVIYCTDRVVGTEEFSAEDEFAPKPHGTGGTDLRAAFNWVAEQGIDPACMVVLTDLETPFPSKAPEYPVLWASTLPHTPPWGDRILLKR